MKTSQTFLPLLATAVILACSVANAQTTIYNVGGDSFWSTSSNWSSGVPTSSSAVQIGVQPTGIPDFIVIDTGSTSVASFTLNATLTAPIQFTALSSDTLSVSGPITNLDNDRHTFLLPVSATASTTWTGPLGFNGVVNIGTNQITLSGSSAFSGGTLNFDLTDTSTFGRFLGAGTATFSSETINIGGTYTGVLGQSFDLTTGSFSGVTTVNLPTLTGGLSWNSSSFLSTGVLTVVPEPSVSMLLLALGAMGFAICRPRSFRANA